MRKMDNKLTNTISKAIVPVAGYGTRLYPFTKIINKEFLPVIQNGLLKPQIAVLLENIYDSGIRSICLCVSSKKQMKMYKNFFCKRVKYKSYIDTDKNKIEYDEKMMKIGRCLKFIINKRIDKGFGYSVSLFEKFANNEPVAMFLGDTMYQSNSSSNCITQLLEAYQLLKQPVVGITKIGLKEAKRYGVCTGDFVDENIMKIKSFKEKPEVEVVEKYMLTLKDGKKNCYKVFGNYIITPEIFTALKVSLNISKGESQLTEALDMVSKRGCLYGIEINGRSLDLGNIESYSINFTNVKNNI